MNEIRIRSRWKRVNKKLLLSDNEHSAMRIAFINASTVLTYAPFAELLYLLIGENDAYS